MARVGWGSTDARRLLDDPDLGDATQLLREHGYRWDAPAVRGLLETLQRRPGRPRNAPPRPRGGQRKLLDPELDKARRLIDRGFTLDEIAEELGRPRSTVWSALQRDPDGG